VAQHVIERNGISTNPDHQLQSSRKLRAVCTRRRCVQNRIERIFNSDINIVLIGRASLGRPLLVWPYRHDRSCLITGLRLAKTWGGQLWEGSHQSQAQKRQNAKLSDAHCFVSFGELF